MARKSQRIFDEERRDQRRSVTLCTIAEQYVVAAHGWDSKVCARAENEGKAYVPEAAKAMRL